MDSSLLSEASQLWGLQPGYWDIWGVWHETTPEVERAVLRSIGVPADDAGRLREEIERRRVEQCCELAPPVLVISAAVQPAAIPLRIPASHSDSSVTVEWRGEDGHFGQQHHCVGDLEGDGFLDAGGMRYLAKLLPLGRALPLGYYDLDVRVAPDLAALTRLIVCPDRAWLPPALKRGERRAGLAISLYGVRSAATWGCGDFTALEGVIDWVADQIGGSFVALNPLNAIHNRQPFNTSPYLPNSTYYRNFIYLDIERIEEFRESEKALELCNSPAVRVEVRSLNASDQLEYERVAVLKLCFLKLLFGHFESRVLPGESPRALAFRRYVAAEGELLDRFAVYSALDSWIHERCPDLWIWPEWPEEYRNPSSDAVQRFAAEHSSAVLFHKYVQWLIEEQLEAAQRHARARGLEIGLFHDLPLATDRCGAELWGNRSFHVSGCRVGAPPDGFSPKGQDWSFPPPNRERHRADGYRLFAESIRKAARHGGALRIDHVMRFFRLYWIPDGMSATDGVYVKDYSEDLLRIVALESTRQQVLVVGEDLGTVEPSIRHALERFGILSYRLFYFEKDEGGAFRPPEQYPAHALVSSTTHDLPTLAGFWSGRDIETRREAGLLSGDAAYDRLKRERAAEKQKMLDALFQAKLLPDWFPHSAAETPELTGELHHAITGFLVSTPCLLMTLNQEDLTKETEQQNLPGSIDQYPNWRRKMRFTLEELHASRAARDFAVMFRNWLEKAGRR